MFDRLRDARPLQVGARRAALHFARAGYEVIAGVSALLDEILSSMRDEEDDLRPRPERIEIE